VKLHTQILLALALGAGVGALANTADVAWLQAVLDQLEPLGTVFIRLLTMVVIPLVVASLLVAAANLGGGGKLGRVGGRALAFFLVTTLVASSIGMGLALAVDPGTRMDPAVRDEIVARFGAETGAAEAEEAAAGAAEREGRPLMETLVEMVPRNPVGAAAEMNLLPLIIFTVIFGAAISQVAPERREALVQVCEAVNDGSMVIIRWVMKLAPYAVFAIIAAVIGRFGLDLLQALAVYCVVVAVGLAIHAFGTLALAVRLLARSRVVAFFRQIAEPALLAFSTSSSNATLPVSMETAEGKLGVSKELASFVLPFGATLNMNGSALYKGATVVFIAQVYGLGLGLREQVIIVVTSSLAAVAGAGIPGSSLVTTLIVLNAVGLGAHADAGIALILGVDRILDMLRTTVNVVGDLAATAFIARSEGEALDPALRLARGTGGP